MQKDKRMLATIPHMTCDKIIPSKQYLVLETENCHTDLAL